MLHNSEHILPYIEVGVTIAFSPLQDPESFDDFHDSYRKLSSNKKDHISTSEPSSITTTVTLPRLGKFMPFSTLKGGEPSFKSFLMGGGHDSSKEGTPAGTPTGNNGQLPQQVKS